MFKSYNIPNTKFNIEIDETNFNKYKILLDNIQSPKLRTEWRTYGSGPRSLRTQRVRSEPKGQTSGPGSKSPSSLSDLFKYYLKLSSYNEKEVISEDKINKIDEYLKECRVPEITKLYSLLFDEVPCYR